MAFFIVLFEFFLPNLINGVYLIRREGWKFFSKKNKRPRTAIRNTRVGTCTIAVIYTEMTSADFSAKTTTKSAEGFFLVRDSEQQR